MRAVTVHAGASTVCHSLGEVRGWLHDEGFVWADVEDPEGDLAAGLGLEQPRLAWVGRFDHPPHFEADEKGAAMVVPFVAGHAVTKAHVVVNPSFLLSVHPSPIPVLDELRDRSGTHVVSGAHVALYLFLSASAASFRRALTGIHDELEDIEEETVGRASRQHLLRVAAVRRQLVLLRRGFSPYAGLLAEFVSQLYTRTEVPEEEQRLPRALGAQVAALLQDINAMHEEANHAMETASSLVAMTQGEVINRLTVVSTILLPLTFITGFFGMNFPFLVEMIESPAAFWLFGVALLIVVTVVLILAMRRLGWLRAFDDG